MELSKNLFKPFCFKSLYSSVDKGIGCLTLWHLRDLLLSFHSSLSAFFNLLIKQFFVSLLLPPLDSLDVEKYLFLIFGGVSSWSSCLSVMSSVDFLSSTDLSIIFDIQNSKDSNSKKDLAFLTSIIYPLLSFLIIILVS